MAVVSEQVRPDRLAHAGLSPNEPAISNSPGVFFLLVKMR